MSFTLGENLASIEEFLVITNITDIISFKCGFIHNLLHDFVSKKEFVYALHVENSLILKAFKRT